MPKYLSTNGDEFTIQAEDRGYGGKLTEAFKVDGKGVVTVAGQTISSSGVIGATGAVTATTINASGLIAAAAAVTVGTTLGVTGATTLSSTLNVTGATTLPVATTIGTKTPITGSYFQVICNGIDSTSAAGDITMATPATVAGDVLVTAQGITTVGDLSADFEATVSVGGKLHQLIGVNLSAKVISFIFHRA
jgi:hypothetical protein